MDRFRLTAAAALAATLLSGAAAAEDLGRQGVVEREAAAAYPRLEALYKDIHRHPELGFQEVRTAKLLAAAMRGLGFSVTEGVGRTGVVAVLRNGSGPTILVRTELDALPVEEKTGLPYASRDKAPLNGQETFVDHACGHDVHMAAWVGAAGVLKAMRAHWSGTLVFIAQPAEELVSGARAMIEDGLFTRFPKPDAGFALHVTNAPAGVILYRAGVFTSNADGFKVVFHGRGAHGSMPNASIDPVVMAARFIEDVQSVVSREKDPAAFGVLTVGSVHAGAVGNVIPDAATLLGTIRSYDPEARSRLKAGLERVARAVAVMSDAPPPEVTFDQGASAVVNDGPLTEKTAQVLRAAFGSRVVEMKAPITASEDYSAFIEAGVPSVFFDIGGYRSRVGPNGGPLPTNHSPYFAPDPEPSIKTGMEAMSLAVLARLGS